MQASLRSRCPLWKVSSPFLLPNTSCSNQILTSNPTRANSYRWRTAVRINPELGLPSEYAVDECAHGLSRYARICQEAGLVPIVEPEILIDGSHDIETTAKVQERVISIVYKKLLECGVMMEGTLLKPSMTVNGVDCEDKAKPEKIAELTVRTLQRTVPSAMPGVTFLSGGISEEDSSIYLNEINKVR